MQTQEVDIAIVGGGAAGLAAAIACAQAVTQQPDMSREVGGSTSVAPLRVVVLDGARKLGAKILVSGGGRCNVTHDSATSDDFQGPKNIVRNILRAFDEKQAVAWFESLGVKLKREETGKLFPVSDDAHTVLQALLDRCVQLGVQLLTEHRVSAVERGAGCFLITHSRGVLRARRVVMATGGRSLPKTGSDGQGWGVVRGLGHRVTETYPALVPLVLDGSFFHEKLSGVSHEAELSTFVESKLVDRRAGSLLWTHLGISGPVAMDASRFWVIAQAQGRAVELRCSFVPGSGFERVEQWLVEASGRHPKRSVQMQLCERWPRRVAEVLCEYVGSGVRSASNASGPTAGQSMGKIELGHLPRETRRELVHVLTGCVLPVVRDRGWNHAEVTAGGVPLNEINPATMESRLVPGLFLIGEMLDCEGRIGGFNFQWAWATGHIAGRACSRALT